LQKKDVHAFTSKLKGLSNLLIIFGPCFEQWGLVLAFWSDGLSRSEKTNR